MFADRAAPSQGRSDKSKTWSSQKGQSRRSGPDRNEIIGTCEMANAGRNLWFPKDSDAPVMLSHRGISSISLGIGHPWRSLCGGSSKLTSATAMLAGALEWCYLGAEIRCGMHKKKRLNQQRRIQYPLRPQISILGLLPSVRKQLRCVGLLFPTSLVHHLSDPPYHVLIWSLMCSLLHYLISLLVYMSLLSALTFGDILLKSTSLYKGPLSWGHALPSAALPLRI